MKIFLRYGILLCCCFGPSCRKQKIMNKQISLWRLTKNPYGSQYAYENLNYIFPNATIRTAVRSPFLFERDDTLRTLIVISPRFMPDVDQMNSIIRYASSGNQVFISSLYYADTIMAMLHLHSTETNYDEGDSCEISVMNPANSQWAKFTYPGYSFDNYFTSIDTGHATVLGKDIHGNANFVRLPFANGGAIFIHLNPLAFSNFFLLYKQNKSYYDLALSWLPSKTVIVEWSDFFRYTEKEDSFSALRFIFKNRALRWAFWLTVLLFLLFFLLESKRKQQAVKEIVSSRNASEDFVKTVGRLYYQQKDNQNLAVKMIAAFLENIRSSYNLPTSVLNNEFADKLAFRTGKPLQEVLSVIQLIHDVRLKLAVSDRDLMHLHQQINQFTKPE